MKRCQCGQVTIRKAVIRVLDGAGVWHYLEADGLCRETLGRSRWILNTNERRTHGITPGGIPAPSKREGLV